MAAGGNKKRNSATQKENYKSYERERRWMKNRKARLNKHLKDNPDDTAAKKAIERLSTLVDARSKRRSNGTICKQTGHGIEKTFLPQKSIAEQIRALGIR